MTARTRPLKIAPSLLAADLARAGDEAARVFEAGADILHIDVMDGHFAPNLTFGADIVRCINRVCDIPMGAHLMVTDPGRYLEAFADAGADEVFFHIETDADPVALARRIRELGMQAGITLEMPTPADAIAPLVGEVDAILVMTVKCGYTGQKFHPEPVKKIPELRKMFGGGIDIAVDGGVSVANAAMLVEAGANVLVAGSSVFGAADAAAAVEALRAAGEATLGR